jgi:glutaredoxin
MQAKNTLQELGLPFVDVNLDSYPQCREPMKQRTGKTSVPQIFFNNIHVGGNEDLQKIVSFLSIWKSLNTGNDIYNLVS